jgi:multiple sugar transport system permease protein
MWRVILPLAAPGLAPTAVLCFLEGWKEFILAVTFRNDEAHKTLPECCPWSSSSSSRAST